LRASKISRSICAFVSTPNSLPLATDVSRGAQTDRVAQSAISVGNRGCWARNRRDFPRVSSSHCGGRLIRRELVNSPFVVDSQRRPRRELRIIVTSNIGNVHAIPE